jgi:hypothetical protein
MTDRRTAGSRRFTLKDLNILCWLFFVGFLLIPIALIVHRNVQNGSFLEKTPERDFIYFYSMGRLLNDHPPSELYNYELQKHVATEVHALTNREYGPNPYPPFVGVLFRPFANLSFFKAYALWLVISFCLYITGLALAGRCFFPGDAIRQSLTFCFALAYLPFLWIMIGGQLPAIGFIGLAIAFFTEYRGRPVLSGLGFSLCLYKPTLLLLILPMLLLSRRHRHLMGLAIGAISLGLFTTAMEGIQIWSGYVHLLFTFGSAALRTHGYRELKYYMDLASFSSLLPGGRSLPGAGILMASACCAVFALGRAWVRYGRSGNSVTTLVWAATITWTLVLNTYVPIYDSILAVISTIATIAVLKSCPDTPLRRLFNVLWPLTVGASWITVAMAQSSGFQILTVLFALLGTVQLLAVFHIAKAEPQRAANLFSRA